MPCLSAPCDCAAEGPAAAAAERGALRGRRLPVQMAVPQLVPQPGRRPFPLLPQRGACYLHDLATLRVLSQQAVKAVVHADEIRAGNAMQDEYRELYSDCRAVSLGR